MVAEPPPKPANVVATPSAASARPISGSVSVAGHLADRLDVADVLGDQRDHRGQEHRQHRQRERRGLELRQPHPRRRLDRGRVDVAQDRAPAGSRATTARKIASLPMMPRKNASVATSSTRVTSPTSGPFSKFDLGGGRQVEPDQRDDRARHHRRQRHVDPMGADQVHDRADDDQDDADRDQTAKRAAGPVARPRPPSPARSPRSSNPR